MKFKMHCPFCNQKIEAEEEWQGLQAECPCCSKMFIIKKEENNASRPVITIQLNNENQFAKGYNYRTDVPPVMNNTRYIPNHMTKAVLATLFFFVPFGLISFYYATKVNNLILREDYAGAEQASDNANLWFFLSIPAGIIAFIILCIIIG